MDYRAFFQNIWNSGLSEAVDQQSDTLSKDAIAAYIGEIGSLTVKRCPDLYAIVRSPEGETLSFKIAGQEVELVRADGRSVVLRELLEGLDHLLKSKPTDRIFHSVRGPASQLAPVYAAVG